MKLLRRLAWWACLAASIYEATVAPLVLCVLIEAWEWWQERRRVRRLIEQERVTAWREAIGLLKNRGRS